MSELVFTAPGTNPFQAIAERVKKSKKLVVVTYNTDAGKGSFNKFLQLRSKGTQLILFANIPGRWDEYFGPHQGRETRRKAKIGIDKVIAANDPRNFGSKDVEIRFCFENHAKIVVCDEQVAYVGSANFSAASRDNFEAGYVTEAAEELAAIAEFIAEIRCSSISYNAIASSPALRALFEFAVNIASFIETFEWETKEWSMNYLVDDYEASFSVEKFGMPADVIEGVRVAVAAAQTIEAKGDQGLATLDERSFLAAQVPDQLRGLLELAAAIQSREALQQRSAAALLSDFMERSMDDPDDIQQSGAFQEALADQDARATKRAEAASTEFIAGMRVAQKAITGAFSATPKADNTG